MKNSNNKIFIIAQGRSGSTLIWNIFRHIPECVAYCEPLHDTLAHNIAKRIVPHENSRHWKVDEYWSEYKSIPRILDKCAGKEAPADEILDWLEWIGDKSPQEKIPVYKILRMWGKIKELRERFPESKIIHLWRDIGPQLDSFLKGGFKNNGLVHVDYFGEWQYGYSGWYPNVKVPDRVDGDAFLSFYKEIWLTAREEGARYSDFSLHYETLMIRPERELRRMLEAVDFEQYTDNILDLVVQPTDRKK